MILTGDAIASGKILIEDNDRCVTLLSVTPPVMTVKYYIVFIAAADQSAHHSHLSLSSRGDLFSDIHFDV